MGRKDCAGDVVHLWVDPSCCSGASLHCIASLFRGLKEPAHIPSLLQ